MSSPNRRDFIKTSALLAAASALPKHGLAAARTEAPGLNVFSKHLQFLDYKELAKAAKDIGFQGIDLTVRPGGHVEPEHVTRDLPKVVEACRSQGLETPMMTTAVDDADDPLDQAVLKTAAQFDIRRYRMNWYRYHEQLSMPDSLGEYQKSIQKLDRLNRELGLIGCYQNHAGTLVGASLWEVWQILQSASQEHFGVQYDIRHATVEGGRSWTNGFHLVKDRIKTIVIKDCKWEKRDGRTHLVNTPLGEGMVDFPRYLKLLKEAKIDVPISLHFEYDLGGAEKGRRKIEKSPDFVFESMERDIATFRRLWAEA
ncbi:TIM barrel protein [Pelagicoccus sp. SDUM812005]|uniref:sugar phosphate isomerase/epimerase family protein n=1 Tax=Pelagicoccus sp. SDUM812005 TaxID=3041257 RepID=UPI00280DB30F|nr:TIM barrel protein [Pelagicoccus sp. SDUM812005]MDQ8182046.1 TIM barrel protein [Pelagicoccus sp. SDUM812005]